MKNRQQLLREWKLMDNPKPTWEQFKRMQFGKKKFDKSN